MKQHLNTIIIAVGIILAALILGNSWKKTHIGNGTINVSGIAKQDFVSDQIVWQGYISAEAKTTKAAYLELKKDTGILKRYLISKGIKAKEMVFSSVEITTDYEDNYNRDKDGFRIRKFMGYVLTQRLRVESKDVENVENVSREISELIDYGVNYITENTEYYYSKIDELKIKMLADATAQARKRGEAIASNSKSELGDLEKSEMSTFQINAKNSAEEFTEASQADYYNGESYNTTSKNKTAIVTVKLDFGIR